MWRQEFELSGAHHRAWMLLSYFCHLALDLSDSQNKVNETEADFLKALLFLSQLIV